MQGQTGSQPVRRLSREERQPRRDQAFLNRHFEEVLRIVTIDNALYKTGYYLAKRNDRLLACRRPGARPEHPPEPSVLTWLHEHLDLLDAASAAACRLDAAGYDITTDHVRRRFVYTRRGIAR